MTRQQAIKILMLSPFYFKLGPVKRMRLIKEYCNLYWEIRRHPRLKEEREE